MAKRRPGSDSIGLTDVIAGKMPSARYMKVTVAPEAAKKRAVPIGSVQAGHRPGAMTNKAGQD